MFKPLLIAVLALAVAAAAVFVGGKYLGKETAERTPPGVKTAEAEFIIIERKGPYSDYSVINGTVSGEWVAFAGPNVHGGSKFYFLPDASFRARVPQNRFGTVSERFFISQNSLPARDLFGVNLQELETSGKDCEISGGNAIIKISGYHVLEAEIGGTDYADLDNVISYNPQTLQECK